MRRRVPLQTLRGSDPKLLEIQLQDLFSRPGSQLEPLNLLDLFALGEHPEPPKPIQRALTAFLSRVSQELADIPDGSAMRELVAEYADIDPARVPASFRALVQRLAAREGRDGDGLRGLLARWEGSDPTPFVLGVGAVRVQKAAIANAPSTSRPEARGERRSAGASMGSRTPPAPRAKPVADLERQQWIIDTVLARLSESSEQGLGEAVLVAGIRHRGRDVYPNLAPQDVTTVLQDLLKVGRLRKSAGRWSRAR